jgi:hypothetical protein
MPGEKSDFEKGVESIAQRESKGRPRNENVDRELRRMEGEREPPEIFRRVHERYQEEDRKGNFKND